MLALERKEIEEEGMKDVEAADEMLREIDALHALRAVELTAKRKP